MVSAIILSYNRCTEVLFTIIKLEEFRATLPFDLEIIVVDNASTDHTSAEIIALHPKVTLVTRAKNNGIAGWNSGFEIATHPYFLVLDDDSHIESGLIEAVEYMQQNCDIGVLALNITGGNYETSNWKDKEEGIGFIGCGALIAKELYGSIGGFAEWMHVYGHEWEYGIRAIEGGYKIRYFGNSSVLHRTSALNRSNKNLRIYSTRNEMGIVYKYFRKDRVKNVLRVWLNSMKVIGQEGFTSAFYCFIGGVKFLQLKPNLLYTPVSESTQVFFSRIFWGTQPAFGFLRKRWCSFFGHKKSRRNP
jgi:GT2 family glycosyltransferase